MVAAFVLTIGGVRATLDVRPHREDAGKLVVKSRHPEAGGIIAQLGGLPAPETRQGSRYFVTILDRETFYKALPKIVDAALQDAINYKASLAEQKSHLQLVSSMDDEGEDEDFEDEASTDDLDA